MVEYAPAPGDVPHHLAVVPLIGLDIADFMEDHLAIRGLSQDSDERFDFQDVE